MSLELATAALLAPASCLVAMVLVPSGLAERSVVRFRQVVTSIAMTQFCISLIMLGAYGVGMLPVLTKQIILPAAIGIHFDGIAALMLVLVSFVGWVICSYSIRYLDGEATEGRYYRWTAFTIGSVSLLVISGNLLMFMACWVMTSLGLHQLLLHYAHRPAAQRAAWTKFGISRLGDAALVGAIVLIYSEFKTIHFRELFAATQSVSEATPAISAAVFLLVIGAITKSAMRWSVSEAGVSNLLVVGSSNVNLASTEAAWLGGHGEAQVSPSGYDRLLDGSRQVQGQTQRAKTHFAQQVNQLFGNSSLQKAMLDGRVQLYLLFYLAMSGAFLSYDLATKRFKPLQ